MDDVSAPLRVRGANPRDLRQIAVSKPLVFAGAGTVPGIVLGAASVVVILGGTPFFRAAPADLIVSGLCAPGSER